MARPEHAVLTPPKGLWRPVSGLSVDEKVWAFEERVRDKPQHGLHRYQHIWVRRGDSEYEFVLEMGPESRYANCPQIGKSWTAGLYSVGEVIEICQMLREGKDPEPTEPSDLIGQWQQQEEEKRALRAHRSVIGAHITIQRG